MNTKKMSWWKRGVVSLAVLGALMGGAVFCATAMADGSAVMRYTCTSYEWTCHTVCRNVYLPGQYWPVNVCTTVCTQPPNFVGPPSRNECLMY